ncbi:MAG: hypothetical protein ACXVZH_09170 [Terriglobales bacterium]
MRVTKLAGLALIPLLVAAAPSQRARNVAQTSVSQTAARPNPAPKTPPLSNADVVKMVKGGLQESTILSVIATTDCDFDVSVDGLLALKEAGVSDKVMDAMLAAAARKRAPAAAPAPVMPQATLIQNSDAMGMSSSGMTQLSPAQRQQMAAAMSQMGGMNGMAGMGGGLMMSPAELPQIKLLLGPEKKLMASSMAQMAQSTTKGMPGAGSSAGSTLQSFATQGLTFAAIAGGGMFAAPAMGIASGMMGGMMGGHRGLPTTTYIWALPGRASSYTMPTTLPKFELEFGDITGLDPDAYEPALVHLPQATDNWRLVGATKQKMSYMGAAEQQSMIDEERTLLKVTRMERGHLQIEPAAPLAPGEYGIVLRPTKAHKPKKGVSQSQAQQGVFYSVWDFSIPGETADVVPAKKH